MKKTIYFLAITLILCYAKIKAGNGEIIKAKNDDITIDYKGFYALVDSYHYNQLIFTIQNNTNDTLYISTDHIHAQVVKNGQILKEKKLPRNVDLFPPDFMTEWVFMTDVTNPRFKLNSDGKELRKQLVDSLKSRFAKKLYDRNRDVTKHFTKDFFNAAMGSVCLVIFPKERINYDRLFISTSLDNTCIVKPIYKQTKVFTTLKDGYGVDIKLTAL